MMNIERRIKFEKPSVSEEWVGALSYIFTSLWVFDIDFVLANTLVFTRHISLEKKTKTNQTWWDFTFQYLF